MPAAHLVSAYKRLAIRAWKHHLDDSVSHSAILDRARVGRDESPGRGFEAYCRGEAPQQAVTAGRRGHGISWPKRTRSCSKFTDPRFFRAKRIDQASSNVTCDWTQDCHLSPWQRVAVQGEFCPAIRASVSAWSEATLWGGKWRL